MGVNYSITNLYLCLSPFHCGVGCFLNSGLQMEDARLGLQASLLVRSAETGELFVNFDPEILTQVRESEGMIRMKLEIPPFAALLRERQTSLKTNFNKLQVQLLCAYLCCRAP